MDMHMNIESAQYLASGSILATIDGQQMTIPNDPGNRHYQAVMAWGTPAPVPAPSAEEVRVDLHRQINAERTRRIETGAAFAVPGIDAPIHLTGRANDQSVYLALLIRAQGAKSIGVDAPILTLRDGSDNILSLTPDQMIVLVGQAMTWFENVMAVSWDMKDLTGAFTEGVPDDWRSDTYWP